MPVTFLAALASAVAFTATAAPAVPPGLPIATARALPERRVIGDKALKALAAWLKHYRSGKIDIYSTDLVHRAPTQVDWHPQKIDAKQSFAVRFGLAPKSGLADSTWLGDLEAIGKEVVADDSPDAADLLVELAAIGFDGEKYTRVQAPHIVRARGDAWLGKLRAEAARARVAAIAADGGLIDKKRAVASQGAALRGLAAFGEDRFRATIEQQLARPEPLLRYHAAEALARLHAEGSAPALIAALAAETSDEVLPAIVEALRAIYGRYLPELGQDGETPKGKTGNSESPGSAAERDAPKADDAAPVAAPPKPPAWTRQAVETALAAIGRTTWRGDMALLRLLDDLRAKDSIPALIGVLERFRDEPEAVQSGKLSTLVLHRAHELLVTMTGAVFPANEPAQWRELWDREKDKIDVGRRHGTGGTATTVASGFCGIPVEGSRVVFILDLSRSMTFAMKRGEDAATRMDYARRELEAAMDSISEASSFNLITFNGDDEAELWNKKLVPATDKNREKFKKHLAKLEPDGGTNLWSALEVALQVETLSYAERYEKVVDEIFILSDGAPSVGEVLDPIEILRLVREANRFAKMRINTVFISSDDPPEERGNMRMPWMGEVKPEELMRRLAEENGGKCVIL
ncbi:MAG: VWA domain-containing protein [Planctomycetes bacterium]|nr:VWA domain-containing protein [Planctomycetota bacterium]